MTPNELSTPSDPGRSGVAPFSTASYSNPVQEEMFKKLENEMKASLQEKATKEDLNHVLQSLQSLWTQFGVLKSQLPQLPLENDDGFSCVSGCSTPTQTGSVFPFTPGTFSIASEGGVAEVNSNLGASSLEELLESQGVLSESKEFIPLQGQRKVRRWYMWTKESPHIKLTQRSFVSVFGEITRTVELRPLTMLQDCTLRPALAFKSTEHKAQWPKLANEFGVDVSDSENHGHDSLMIRLEERAAADDIYRACRHVENSLRERVEGATENWNFETVEDSPFSSKDFHILQPTSSVPLSTKSPLRQFVPSSKPPRATHWFCDDRAL